MTLTQRIDNILGPWPTPDRVREGILLLARHLQRHDELVTLQRDIDAYATDRRMPDDALDSFEAQRDALRREIWEETVGRLAEGGAGQCEAAADNAAESLDLEAIESRAQRLMIATWECDKLSYTDQWQLTNCDVPALVAEVRRLHAERDKAQAEVAEHRRHVATVMQREDALKKRVEELEDTLQSERERADREAQIGAIRLSRAEQRLRNNQACQLSEQKKDRQMIADLLRKLERAEAQNQSGKGAS